MNPIHKKKIKRKRILQGRVTCHGNNMKCSMAHPPAKRVPSVVRPTEYEVIPKPKEEKPKKGFFSKIFK